MLEAITLKEKEKADKKGYTLASRAHKESDTIIEVKGIKIGGSGFVVMAGPCTIENIDGLFEIAREVKKAGATVLRGGAFKPRTSPYSFQGLGKAGLQMLREVGDELGLVTVSEVMDGRDVGMVADYVDVVVHVFDKEYREYYELENLWGDAKRVELE